jgi:hypothetical protein
MMAVEEWSYPDTVFSCDACLEGCSEISTTLSGVTSSVIFSESNVTPKKVIFVVGVTALSTDSSKPQDIQHQ